MDQNESRWNLLISSRKILIMSGVIISADDMEEIDKKLTPHYTASSLPGSELTYYKIS